MTQLSQQVVVDPNLVDDALILGSLFTDQVRRLKSFAKAVDSEVDLSTLRISFRRDPMGLVLKTTALEAVTVHSQWVPIVRVGGGPVEKLSNDLRCRVSTIDYTKGTEPWITLSNGRSLRLDYFHREYTRCPEPVAVSKGVNL